MISFELNHCGNSIVISDFCYDLGAERSGNPYNTTFYIAVKSGAFSGIGDCEYDINEFIQFAKQIMIFTNLTAIRLHSAKLDMAAMPPLRWIKQATLQSLEK